MDKASKLKEMVKMHVGASRRSKMKPKKAGIDDIAIEIKKMKPDEASMKPFGEPDGDEEEGLTPEMIELLKKMKR